MARGTPSLNKNLSGKNFLITGATSGIGKRAAIELGSRHANVICASNAPDGTTIVEDMKNSAKSDTLSFKHVDYRSLESVLDFSKEIKNEYSHLDCLLNSAAYHGGLDFGPPNPKKSDFNLTNDGFEEHFQINYLSQVLATNELLPLLKETKPSSRIINTTCLYSFSGELDLSKEVDFSPSDSFNTIRAYALTKYLSILHTHALKKQVQDTGVSAIAMHPGQAFTGLYDNFGKVSRIFFRVLLPSPKRAGRQTAILAGCEDSDVIENGAFVNRKLARMDELLGFVDDDEVERVWHRTNELLDQALTKVNRVKSFAGK